MKLRYPATLFGALVALCVLAAALTPFAEARTPAPGYESFAGCPSPEENPKIEGCVYSVVQSGHFKLGNKDVPITNPITLTGGVEEGLAGFSYNSEGGMRPAKEKVPGGLVGLTGLTWLAEVLGVEALTLYAATELAGTPELGAEEISLPIKVHLINPALGNKCYVGSNSNPIILHLITGTTSPPPPNQPISGSGPKAGFEPVKGLLTLDGTYVDNSFSAPGASGCTLTLLGIIPFGLNSLVDSQSGLPAPAGTNETAQVIHTEIAPSPVVYP